MSLPLYVLLCLIIPLLWGVISSRLFDAWQARLRAARPEADSAESADMYHI
jgi:hypothetical protein